MVMDCHTSYRGKEKGASRLQLKNEHVHLELRPPNVHQTSTCQLFLFFMYFLKMYVMQVADPDPDPDPDSFSDRYLVSGLFLHLSIALLNFFLDILTRAFF